MHGKKFLFLAGVMVLALATVCAADIVSQPAITLIEPTAGCPGTIATLTGTDFDPETLGQYPGREVQFRVVGVWTDAFVHFWTDTEIVFEVPTWPLAPASYFVRVYDDNRDPGSKESNYVNFTVKDCSSPTTITPDLGPCGNYRIKLENPTGIGFGASQDTISGVGATGVYRTVRMAASQGEYIPLKIPTWNNGKVEFKFLQFFEDLDGDFIQDGNEPTIEWCEGLNLQTWNVFVKYIFYGDTDSTASYTDGDFMYQVESSNPLWFELTDDAFITRLNPKKIAKGKASRLRIIGVNFGPTQEPGDEVRLGRNSQYLSDPFNSGKVFQTIKKWSNTKIVVKFFKGVPNAWKGTNKYVWVVKDGVASNKRRVEILP
jgi:hypothetical protein